MHEPFWRRPFYAVVCCTLIIALTYGVRQTYGLFMVPVSETMGWGREAFSIAIATQNLMIGLSVPFLGAAADKWGTVKVVAGSTMLYTVATYLVSQSTTPEAMLASAGFLAGFALGGCGLPLLLSIVGRTAPANKRTTWIGIVTAGATMGQLVMVPATQKLITGYGWVNAIVILSVLTATAIPLAMSLAAVGGKANPRADPQTLTAALKEAGSHSGYVLLVVGFFVCGLQVQFINSHLPAYLADKGIDAAMAATAIATIGLFNMAGVWISGWLGGRMRMKYLLSYIYVARSVVIFAFISLPITPLSITVFSAIIGLLWLSTVPLTSGIVVQVFGTRYMATLYGIVFMGHQIGSFTGVWLGGILYDRTGSYEIAWWVTIVFGLIAASLHVPIKDAPIDRLSGQTA
jgi:predicted MFS family arabinose efflux permease